MVNERGLVVDLHWHLLFECLSPDADVDFWSAAERLDDGSGPLCLLGPTDQLFHACLHGYKHQVDWEQIPPIRWVADALTILTAAGARIDYQRLGRLARERHLGLALKLTLGYLRDRLEAPLPESLVCEMAGWPEAAWEKAEWRTQQKTYAILGSLLMMRRHYLRLKYSMPKGPVVRNFTDYLQCRFSQPNWRGLLFVLAEKGVNGIRRWIGSKRKGNRV
jgi:hypothetical protein